MLPALLPNVNSIMSATNGNISNMQTDTEPPCPNIPTAGKTTAAGETAKDCLQIISRPATPPFIRKFRRCRRPEPGAVKVHHGKSNDPDVASELVHGIKTKFSESSGSLMNPPELTFFQKGVQELNEAVYRSRKKTPSGRLKNSAIPSAYRDKITFGLRTVKGLDVRGLINPPKTVEELEREAQEGHKVYVRSHNSYFVGEQVDRNYNSRHFSKDNTFGIITPHFKDGRNVAEILHWLRDSPSDTMGPKTDQVNKFRSRNLLNLPRDLTFGRPVVPTEFGAGEIIHSTGPSVFVRGPDRHRGLVNAVQQRLKKLNFQRFPSLLQAFRYYDKKGKGMIDREDLHTVCRQFQLDFRDTVLDELMDYCDKDKDGLINFLEFANFLNWKDLMPINTLEQDIIAHEYHAHTAPAITEAETVSASEQLPAPQALIKPEDLEPTEPGSSLKTPRTVRQAKAFPGQFTTTSSIIGRTSNDLLPLNTRVCGIPTVRYDLPIPRFRRVSDNTNYGDSSTAADLMHPTVYDLHGVNEQHFFCPRTKKEIAEIFHNLCVNISEETFEEAWKLASLRHPDGEVSVEVFRNVLKELKAM